MAAKPSDGPAQIAIIIGVSDLEEYLRSIKIPMSRPTLMKYIKAGLPCWFEFGKYHFHIENINAFFKAKTAKSIQDPQEETA